MTDEPPEPAAPLIDRYRKLLDDHGISVVMGKLKTIERLLWYAASGKKPLFEEELAEVRERGQSRSIPRPDLLILCVGYSPEPLLLTLAHHAPADIVLLKEASLKDEYLSSLQEL